ncbi:mechanosensitive ion channel [Acetobacter sp. TBRC 12305]|uniref:Mechanosensitive ion channel n=1 Tax=Acetobacter garciniae TaxID=2817435 RepID=A0A939HMI9_9PROT|nr:mechanosensitive ion channel domain-containing protein [Acetobacter garciniae]MBO1324389.1 mechanosensitive ion channel [Acetobacter garciniae]MBX0344078.1 mechanosensitive ion channel [Acetobacter garciniae]
MAVTTPDQTLSSHPRSLTRRLGVVFERKRLAALVWVSVACCLGLLATTPPAAFAQAAATADAPAHADAANAGNPDAGTDGQGGAAPSSAPPHAAPQTAPPGGLTQQDAQQLLGVLNDPQKRAEFSKNLALMAKGLPVAPAQPGGKSAAPAKAATPPDSADADTPVVIDSSVHSALDGLNDGLRGYVHNFTSLFTDLGVVGTWLKTELRNPTTRQTLLDAFSRAILILAVALLAERGTSISLKKPLLSVTRYAIARENRHLARQEQGADADNVADSAAANADTTHARETDQRRGNEVLRYLIRVPYNALHFLIKLLPVAVCLLLGYVGAEFLTTTPQARTVTLTLVNAYAIARVLYLVVETTLVPHSPSIRLIPAQDATARLLTHWWNILVAAPSIVICLSTLGEEFDLAQRGVDAMLRAVVLIQHLIIAAFIWRMRRIVARALQPSADRQAKSALWAFVGTLAHLWWVPIMFLDMALWFVWAAHLKGGYQWILRGSIMSLVCLALSRVLALLAYGLQDKLFRVSPAMQAQYPDLQQRADFYYPFVRKIITAFLIFATAVCLAQSWGAPALRFFFVSALGVRLMGAALSLVLGMTVAAVAWEVVNHTLNKQISRYASSAQAGRAARLRTVLPIIRTVLLAVIIIFVAVTTLSQIGINVTPLLTGAGILGVGLSFGSQSLVKDVITGFFMLAEDAIQVGDWVTAAGIAGTVEHLSIRTLRVRAIDGDLHIIPFSSVTSIANTARGFNQIIVRQTLDLSEDSEKVVEIMKKTIAAMRKEDDFRAIILSDYTDLGVDNSDGNGAIMVGAIRTAPMMKWKVQREFYRRIAPLMADAGIKFFTPTSYSTSPPDIPVHLALDSMPPMAMPQAASPQAADAQAAGSTPAKAAPAGEDPANTPPSANTPTNHAPTGNTATGNAPSGGKQAE